VNDLRHDANGDFFRCHGPDINAHRDHDPSDVRLRESAFRQGPEQQALLASASQKADIPGVRPERCLDGIEVVVMSACRNNDEGVLPDSKTLKGALEVRYHKLVRIRQVLMICEFLPVIDHGHAKPGEPRQLGQHLPYVARAEDNQVWFQQNRLDIDKDRAPAP